MFSNTPWLLVALIIVPLTLSGPVKRHMLRSSIGDRAIQCERAIRSSETLVLVGMEISKDKVVVNPCGNQQDARSSEWQFSAEALGFKRFRKHSVLVVVDYLPEIKSTPSND